MIIRGNFRSIVELKTVGMNRFYFFKAMSYLKVIGQATLDFKSKGIKPALALMFKSSLVISFLKSDFNLCTAIN